MADNSETQNARIDAAARAILEHWFVRSYVTWDELSLGARSGYRRIARIVLAAADGVPTDDAWTETRSSICPECGFLHYSEEGRAVFDADINAEHMAAQIGERRG